MQQGLECDEEERRAVTRAGARRNRAEQGHGRGWRGSHGPRQADVRGAMGRVELSTSIWAGACPWPPGKGLSHLDTGQGKEEAKACLIALVGSEPWWMALGASGRGQALARPPSMGPSWATVTRTQSLSLPSSHPGGGRRHIKSALLVMHTYLCGSEGYSTWSQRGVDLESFKEMRHLRVL